MSVLIEYSLLIIYIIVSTDSIKMFLLLLGHDNMKELIVGFHCIAFAADNEDPNKVIYTLKKTIHLLKSRCMSFIQAESMKDMLNNYNKCHSYILAGF